MIRPGTGRTAISEWVARGGVVGADEPSAGERRMWIAELARLDLSLLDPGSPDLGFGTGENEHESDGDDDREVSFDGVSVRREERPEGGSGGSASSGVKFEEPPPPPKPMRATSFLLMLPPCQRVGLEDYLHKALDHNSWRRWINYSCLVPDPDFDASTTWPWILRTDLVEGQVAASTGAVPGGKCPAAPRR